MTIEIIFRFFSSQRGTVIHITRKVTLQVLVLVMMIVLMEDRGRQIGNTAVDRQGLLDQARPVRHQYQIDMGQEEEQVQVKVIPIVTILEEQR